MASINRVVLVGNLTRDPELKSLPSGMAVCDLGLAVNHRRKNQQTGEWVEEPNYFTRVGVRRPGRELRAVPHEGPRGGDRRPAALAPVGRAGRHASARQSTSWPRPCSSSARATATAAAAAARRRRLAGTPGPAAGSRWPARPSPPWGGGGGDVDDDIPF